MRMPFLAPLLLAPVLATAAMAQAPVITPAGDPSVRADTIYRLAVDPARYPDDPYIYLLDDGVIRLEPDGRATRTYRQVVQILSQQGAERWGEQQFSYSAAHERLTVNWIRVLRPDGTVVSPKPTHEQESDALASLDAPVYSDVRILRATLGGVVPGVLVDYSYTVTTTHPVLPGDFFTTWSVTNAEPTLRSRFLLDVPASLTPRLVERNLTFARRTTVAHGRRVYEWATADVPKPPPAEPFASDSNGVDQNVTVAAPESWETIARWYDSLARGRDSVGPALAESLAAVVRGAATARDSLRAVYQWVAQDFRYVSVALGLGGYQPRLPDQVLATKYGDCKDKATLFVALARRMGFRADPVLLSAEGGVDSTLPSIAQFDHMIAVVRRPGGPRYLDLTADEVPYGELPPGEYGQFALVVHPDGHGEEVRLPLDSIGTNVAVDSLVGDLTATGAFAGRLTRLRSGRAALALRMELARPFTAEERGEIARGIASGLVEGAVGDSLQLFDGRDLTAVPRISVAIQSVQALRDAGADLSLLRLPLGPLFSTARVADVTAHVPRRYPIDAAAVLGPVAFREVFAITLPAGWHAQLPAGVSDSSVYGVYHSTYTQQGRVLTVERTGRGARGVLPPGQVSGLIAFLRTLSRDDGRYLILQH